MERKHGGVGEAFHALSGQAISQHLGVLINWNLSKSHYLGVFIEASLCRHD